VRGGPEGRHFSGRAAADNHDCGAHVTATKPWGDTLSTAPNELQRTLSRAKTDLRDAGVIGAFDIFRHVPGPGYRFHSLPVEIILWAP